MKLRHSISIGFATWLLLLSMMPAAAAPRQVMSGHVPAVLAGLKSAGNFAGTNHLNLAIGLPLRNQEALTHLLREIYDPASPNYRHYLTPEQFTEQFGPTEKDYQAVIAFAKANGLTVTGTDPTRMLVDVSGSVADIERALHVTLRVYQHPTEKRRFHAPDAEPSLDLAVPVLRISGLDNYSLPRPRLQATLLAHASKALPNAGSGPGGAYMGKDFRAAYVPDSSLNGSGQIVGLLQFDGYTASDITYYENQAGLPNITLSNVLIDGASGGPSGTGGEVEVSLDIEMAISMATNLTGVMVYMAPNPSPWEDLLNRMANDNVAKQLSCSWYEPGGAANTNTDQIFQKMAAQGQSFFSASGDYDAFTGLIPFPGDTPYITQVGGTTLTTSGPGGSWVSETVWNWGGGIGSGGGISTQYPIPSWQTNINMTTNQGSTTMRNTPDVALTADNVYVRANGQNYNVGGTSCAAPLWAGFTALINQQAVNNGEATVGFINPAISTIGLGGIYASALHDVATGNNTSGSSPSKFYAVTGYDLCTGWGTPAGQTLVDALVGPPVPTPPSITTQPQSRTNVSGSTANFNVYAAGSFPLIYQWKFNGTNIDGATNTVLTLANVQPTNAGTYSVMVTNLYGSVTSSNATLTVLTLPPTITSQPSNQTVYVGFTAVFNIMATGSLPLNYQWKFNGTNITGATNTTLTLTNAQFSQAGNYAVLVTNLYGSILSSNAVLTVNPLPPCAPVSLGLVSWWPGEGNAYDVAGTNNGILQGGVSFASGEVGQAFVFNGSSTSIKVPASPSLTVGAGNGLTLETWINPAAATLNVLQSIMEWNQGSGGQPIGAQLGMSVFYDGSLYANLLDTTGNGHLLNSDPGLMTTNFQHIAVTYDKTTGTAVLYRNGVVVQTANLGVFDPQTTYDFYIGVRPAGPYANHFNGMIDEPSVYNRALSAADIQAIYNAGSAGKCSLIAPVITSQPTNQTVTVGRTANFNVTASGASPLSYQWRFNGTNIVGATNTTLTLTNVQLSQAGNYAVLVTNLYGSILSSNAVLTVNPRPPCTPAPSGLGGWWPGEGNANDVVGNNNGTLVNGVTFTDGTVGQAFSFNGTSSYVSISDSPSLDAFVSQITIEAWIKSNRTNADSDWEGIITKGNSSWRLQATAGATTLTFSTTGILPHEDLYGSRNVYDGQWHHVAGVYNGTNMYLYVDGTLDVSQPATGSIAQNSYPMCIGKNAWGTGYYFNGLVDEVSIYNRALTASEIYAIYAAGSGGKCPPTTPVIIAQPTNQTIAVGGTANFNVTASGALPLSYQWIFSGTNISGATNTTLTLTNVQLNQAGNYAVLVTNVYGSVLSSNAALTVTLDHFTWNPIPSPRFINTPFAVIIRAQDMTNGLFTNFTGTAILNTTNGIAVTPPVSGNFIQGVWTGAVTIAQPGSNLVLQANDGLGHLGLANPINVISLPQLGMLCSGNIALFMWPVGYPEFVLETSASLSPAAWAVVPYSPIQVGDEYILPLVMTGTNGFYRLWFPGP